MRQVRTIAERDTQTRILHEAERLFTIHGFAAVSMRQVAEAVGLTKPALYYHFRDKECLYVRLHLHMLEELRARIDRAITAETSLSEQVWRVIDVLLQNTTMHPARLQAEMAEHLSDESRQTVAAAFQHDVQAPLYALFAQAIAEHEIAAALPPAVAAQALLGLALAFLGPGASMVFPEASRPTETAQVLAQLLLYGLVGQHPHDNSKIQENI